MRPLADLAPFFTLEDVAAELGGTADHLRALAHAGALQTIVVKLDGRNRTCISRDERTRLRAELGAAAQEHPGKVRSLLYLLGMGMTIWTGEDAAILDCPYKCRDQLAGDALNALEIATTGTDKQRRLLRTRETDAELIAEALKVFRESGLYRTPAERTRDAEIRQARQRAGVMAGGPPAPTGPVDGDQAAVTTPPKPEATKQASAAGD